MRYCFFGGYSSSYPRNAIIRKGLRMSGAEVLECNPDRRYKFWLRYPFLAAHWARICRRHNFFFIPEFCQKDVPLAKFLSFFSSKKIIFDPLASRFETKIADWRRRPADSPEAWWNYEIDLWAFRLSHLVLADTQAHKDYYCEKYRLPSEKVEVLPVGFDDSFFKPSPARVDKEQRDRFTVLFYGSFLPLHGVEVIIQAAAITWKEDRSIRFGLIGSGQTLPQAKAEAAKLGLSNVRFEGWTTPGKLVEKIASSDICLGIFGRTEKANRVVPHKIYQSLGMKKAVVTTRTQALEEFFSDREDIFLCPEPRPELLAEAILELKENKVLREGIAERGYQYVKENFTPQALGRRLIEITEKHFIH